MALRSFTLLPELEPPRKKLNALPDVELVGLSRVWNKPVRIPIEKSPCVLGMKKAPLF
jgi:hypothetical protein